MATARSWELPTRGWRVAAAVAAAAMLGWLAWHAASAVLTVDRLRDSHYEASAVHDSILRLETEIQRTAQLFIATGQTRWLSLHSRTESELRSVLAGLLAELHEGGKPGAEWIVEALAALDALSGIENEAFALLDAGMEQAALARVTGPEYLAGLDWLGESIRHFDERYHDWLLSESLGLTRREVTSLLGASMLFALAIIAWLALVRRLQHEKRALAEEMTARLRAEDELLRAQKLELLGQLAGGVAHDLENVLSATAGYTSLARNSVDEQHRKCALDGLDRAVGLGRGLVANLLSYVRREDSVHVPVELRALLRDAADWLAPLVPDNVRLVIDEAGPEELWASADPVQLHQVFANLALNSFDAMPAGGDLRIALAAVSPSQVGLTPDRGDGFARLVFADSGHGMDADTLARAREPFFSRKPDGRGSGLGLGSVDRILDAHGGRLDLESTVGAGTRATVILPLIAPPAPTGVEPSARPCVMLAGPDPYARQLLADALEDAGLAVTQSATEPAAEYPPAQVGAGQVRVIDCPGTFAEMPVELRALLASEPRTTLVLLLEPGDRTSQAQTSTALGDDRIYVVSRAAPLGEVASFVRRVALGEGGGA